MDVLGRYSEVPLPSDPLYRLPIQVVISFIPRYCFIQVSPTIPLLTPETSANKSDSVYNNQVRVCTRSQLVIQLESNEVPVTCMEYLTVCDGTRLSRSCGNYVALLRRFLDSIVYLHSRLQGHPLECLIYCVLRSASLNYSESNAFRFWIGHNIIWVD